MKKKILLITGLCLCTTGFAAGGGPKFQSGVGYYIMFFGTPLTLYESNIGFGELLSGDEDFDGSFSIKSMPLGAIGYGGIGYGFGDTENFSAGIEGALSMSYSVKPLGLFYIGLQGRGFAKYEFLEHMSVTGFGGVRGNFSILKLLRGGKEYTGAFPVFGIRAEVYMFYLEYAIVPAKDFSSIFWHDLSIGVTFLNF